MYTCPNTDCSFQNESLNSLRIHCQKKHKLPSADMIVAVLHNGVWPLCECGCGEKLKYKNLASGFGRLKRGHINRIPGHNTFHQPGSSEKMTATLKRRYASGEIKVWNKDQSKDTDQRLVDAGIAISATWNDVRRTEYSKTMTENRLSGIVPTLHGHDHPQWQGGTSPIYALVNAQTRFWTKWKTPIKQRDNNRCTRCGVSASLEVHHDGERMADIVRKITTKHNPDLTEMSWEMKMTVVDDVIDYHITQSVSGVTLCKTCHVAVHKELGETYNVK